MYTSGLYACMIHIHITELLHTPGPSVEFLKLQQAWPTLMPFEDGIIVGHEQPDVIVVLTLSGHKRVSIINHQVVIYHE